MRWILIDDAAAEKVLNLLPEIGKALEAFISGADVPTRIQPEVAYYIKRWLNLAKSEESMCAVIESSLDAMGEQISTSAMSN